MDAYTTLKKQYLMLKTIILFYKNSLRGMERGKTLEEILKNPLREKIARMKYIPEDHFEEILELQKFEGFGNV